MRTFSMKRRSLIQAKSLSWLDGMYSRWMKCVVVALMASSPLLAAGEEILIYRGEEITLSEEESKEELRFVREFFISREQGVKQRKVHANLGEKPPLSAARAMELAEASLEPSQSDGDDDAHVTKLELRHRPVGDPQAPELSISYYVVNFHVDGSEVQRLVLMDGTVVKPQLTRLPEKTPDH
jgi:hypothetical protein